MCAGDHCVRSEERLVEICIQDIADSNQAIGLLESMHHWSSTKVNRSGRSGYSITITHAGKRVTAQRVRFVDAAIAAIGKLRAKEKPAKLKLAGEYGMADNVIELNDTALDDAVYASDKPVLVHFWAPWSGACK